MTRRLLASVALILLLLGAPARAAWQEDLIAEIRAAHGCTVAYLSQVVERTVDGRQIVFAKVHCEDGRVFDASRTNALEPFVFRECAPAREPQGC